jgi:DNA modification methylase
MKKMKNENKINEPNRNTVWFNELKRDCRKILKEWDKINLPYRWKIGKRILQDWRKFGKPKYGSKKMGYLSADLKIPLSTLYKYVQFAEKYPNSESLKSEVLDNKKLTWTKIKNEILPKKRIVEDTSENRYISQPFNAWDIQKPSQDYGIQNYPGRLAPEILFDVIYMLSEKGELVVDPMAGGGTTVDVCKEMKRRCVAYDIKPRRQDIIERDITTGIPVEDNSVDLFIFDPPYEQMLKGRFNKLPTDLSNMEPEDFYKSIDKISKEIFRGLKPGKKVFFIIEQSLKWESSEDISWKCYEIFLRNGFKYFVRGGALYSKFLKKRYIPRARKEKKFLSLFRDVFILKKPE